MKVSGSTPGTFAPVASVTDVNGSGVVAVQVAIPAGTTATYSILGKAAASGPWVALKTGQTADLVETANWLPWFALRIETIAGSGPVTMWVESS